MKKIREMSEDELREFLYKEVCMTPSCFNIPAYGLRICEHCAYGEPQRADDHIIRAKKRLNRIKAKYSDVGV